MAEGNHYYQSLKRRLVIIVMVVSLTPLVLVSGIILGQFRNSYQEKVRAHLGELVQKHRQNIDTFLEHKLNVIRFLVDARSFSELSNEAFLQQTLVRLQEQFGGVFQDLGVVNAEGSQLAYAGPFTLGHADYSDAEWFKDAMRNDYYISDVFLGLRGLPHFIIAVRQSYKGTYWILRSTIDFKAFNTLVENLRIGKTGFAFILNKEGEFQTRPFFTAESDVQRYISLVKNGLDCKDGVCIVERHSEAGKENIYVASFLKNGDWLLVYQQATADAFADLRRAQGIAFAILLLGGIGIITMAYVLSGRMIHRIEQADRDKEMMNEQVIETGRLASIGELAAGIAHEINNPVAIMVEEAGWMEDLLAEEDLRETENLGEFRRALNQIRNQGKRCKEITHKLLSFARKTDTRIQEVDLNELIEEVISLSEQRARYGNVTIKQNLDPELPPVKVSPTEIQQVLLNLINNALDAMDKKGGTIDIGSSAEHDSIVVSVADAAPGIQQVNLQRIFDPFFTTKPVGKGTGLGLSICYGIVHKMGGTIQVESAVGKGTAFRVTIPFPKQKRASEPAA